MTCSNKSGLTVPKDKTAFLQRATYFYAFCTFKSVSVNEKDS